MLREDGDKWVSFSDIKLLGRSLAGVRESRANGNYPAATASKVSVSKKPSNILSCACGWDGIGVSNAEQKRRYLLLVLESHWRAVWGFRNYR